MSESKLPEKILPVNYAGFFDFNESGIYDTSVINIEDYPNAEQIANEISKRYNNYDKMKAALQDTYSLLVAFDYGTNSPPARTQFLNSIKQLLDSLK